MSTTQPPAQASDEPMPFPPMPRPTVIHTSLGHLFDSFAMHQYAMRYADLVVAATPRATADVERDAERFDFMMRVADNPEGPEALAVEEIGNEQMETDRPESVQMRELIDAAIAATKGAKP